MKIKAQKRDVSGKKVKELRRQDLLPAAVYGPKRESLMIAINPKEFGKIFEQAGTNQLVTLEIEEGSSSQVLIKEVQEDPVKQEYIHVSFYETDATAIITADVPVEVTGISPAVKNNIGFLVTPIGQVTVRCLPKDIPANIVIDISNLTQVGDSISIESITLPANVELANADVEKTHLAYIAPPQKEIVEEEVVTETAEAVEGEEGAETATEEEGEK